MSVVSVMRVHKCCQVLSVLIVTRRSFIVPIACTISSHFTFCLLMSLTRSKTSLSISDYSLPI